MKRGKIIAAWGTIHQQLINVKVSLISSVNNDGGNCYGNECAELEEC
jgi:hypothetical protein